MDFCLPKYPCYLTDFFHSNSFRHFLHLKMFSHAIIRTCNVYLTALIQTMLNLQLLRVVPCFRLNCPHTRIFLSPSILCLNLGKVMKLAFT